MVAPMHIVHTEASQGWGGQELRILSEAKGVQERGHRVTLLAPAVSRIYAAAPDWGLAVEAMPFEKKSLSGLMALRSWLQRHSVDLVNTHSSIDSWLTALARLTLPNRQRPAVVRTRHISAPVGRNLTSRWLYLKGADRVVTTGEQLRLDLIQRLEGEEGHFVSIPTGVDLTRFNSESTRTKAEMRDELGIPLDAQVLGIIATLRSWKGHDDLLGAFEQLREAWPKLYLVIAGDGPRYQRIQERIQTNALGDRVKLLGQRQDVPDLMAALDIFLLPSYANEGVPQAIMQAMAMELPVISTSVGAIGELLTHEETGLMVTPRDVAEIAQAIRRLLEDGSLRMACGKAGRQRVEARFSLEQMTDRMETLFQQLLADRC